MPSDAGTLDHEYLCGDKQDLWTRSLCQTKRAISGEGFQLSDDGGLKAAPILQTSWSKIPNINWQRTDLMLNILLAYNLQGLLHSRN